MRRAVGWLLMLVGCTPAHVAQVPAPHDLVRVVTVGGRASDAKADAFAYVRSPNATAEGIKALGPLIAQVESAQGAGDGRATDRAVRALREKLDALGAAQR